MTNKERVSKTSLNLLIVTVILAILCAAMAYAIILHRAAVTAVLAGSIPFAISLFVQNTILWARALRLQGEDRCLNPTTFVPGKS